MALRFAKVAFLSVILLFIFLPAGVRADADSQSGNCGETPADWFKSARTAGVCLSDSLTDPQLEDMFARLAGDGVTVLEVESAISGYHSPESFLKQIDFARRATHIAHRRGLKVVWYYPALEVITLRGKLKTGSGTMKLDHPDWVQQNFDRRGKRFVHKEQFHIVRSYDRESLNYSYGPATSPDPQDENAWMCPNSPYREYFFERLAKLASTGVDGLWLGVPLFSSIESSWPCTDPHCEKKFQEETGFYFPRQLNLFNLTFKQWLLWRHKTLADFLKEAAARAKAANPEVKCIVEVSSCDHIMNTLEGLDATWLDPELNVAWDVTPISDTTAMRDASSRDWLSMMITYKYCKGVLPGKAAWALSHGAEETDAQLVMASALAAQCAPCESGISQKVSSLGDDFRARMFHWIKINSRELFDSESDAKVALIYSPQTRDFVDGVKHGGFYLTSAPPNPAIRWWVKSPDMSLVECDYLTEYKGWGMFLIKNHIPFDIIAANKLDISDLSRYKALILPNLVCISNEERDQILDYTINGGNLLITGEKAGTYDEFGVKRKGTLWSDLGKMGHDFQIETFYGRGKAVIRKDLPG
jgi:hypothetical protein